jgi:hypothetical protein
MTQPARATELIGQLLEDPTAFFEKSAAYQLLQEYLHGHPVDTLRPLLRDERVMVQRAATFVVNELGNAGCMMLPDVLPLVESPDRHVAYDALEIAASCSAAKAAVTFSAVCRALSRDDQALRSLAMRLIARVDDDTLRACVPAFTNEADHMTGLDLLIRKQHLSAEMLGESLAGPSPVVRRYAAVAAVRSADAFPDVIERLRSEDDPDLRRFVEDMTK